MECSCHQYMQISWAELGLLYRNFHQAYQLTLSHLHKTLILPKLEYCSCAWDPHTAILTNSLESVQAFADKLCTKSWSDPSNELIPSLNWPSIGIYRYRQKAQLCCHITIIPSPSYFHPLAKSFQSFHLSLSASHCAICKNQCSFFVSSCAIWNNLP